MGASFPVNEANFVPEVLGASEAMPVIVDFFATWCGPCQVLKPILERLAQEYGVMLATVDIDQNPQLASQYGVEGVPDVRIAHEGQLEPGFVGVWPEAKIRDLLSGYGLRSPLELQLEKAQGAIATGDFPAAKQIFDQLFQEFPNHPAVTLEAVHLLICLDQIEDAQQLLDTIDPKNAEAFNCAQGYKTLIEISQAAPPDGPLAKVLSLTLQGQEETALQELLTLVAATKNPQARQGMVGIFALLGQQHPLTRQYQQELMLALY